MKRPKIPRHIWMGVVLPLVLVGLIIWRLWPVIEEFRGQDVRDAATNPGPRESASVFSRVIVFIASLDYEIINLQNSDPENIAKTISMMYGGQVSSQTIQIEVVPQSRIVIAWGLKENLKVVTHVISRLDAPPSKPQVLVTVVNICQNSSDLSVELAKFEEP